MKNTIKSRCVNEMKKDLEMWVNAAKKKLQDMNKRGKSNSADSIEDAPVYEKSLELQNDSLKQDVEKKRNLNFKLFQDN